MSVSLEKSSRQTNARYHWLDGRIEPCQVIVTQGGRSYVEWPLSVRTMHNVGTVRRVSVWVPTEQLEMSCL